MVVSAVVSGGLAVGPMVEMIDAEVMAGDVSPPAVIPSLVVAR